jgi:septum formation protein
MNNLVLASSSPRRADILRNLGVHFDIIPSDIEEIFTDNKPKDIAKNLAFIKAKDVAARVERDKIILGADTIVCKDDVLLGKPLSKDNAFTMLKELSGSIHKVITGICVIDNRDGTIHQDYEETTVYFKNLTDEEIWHYIHTGEPLDKAGAYGIQGLGGLFVKKIDGCYFNVVGLPVYKLYSLLGKMGVNLLVKEV